jgi:hypothetical protein
MSTTRFDYFREEAADYLRQLGPLLAAKSPPMEALIRLARGLRGAATLAGPPSLSRATRELERGIKGLNEGTFAWQAAADAIRSAVEGLIGLVSSSMPWTGENDRMAISLAERLGEALGHPAPAAPTAAPPGGTAAMKAFLARETAAVAVAVDRVVRQEPGAPGQTRVAMQTVQGLAGLGEYPPLPELFDALEALLAEFGEYPSVPGEARAALSRMGGVLQQASDRLAAGLAPAPDDPRLTQVADALHSALCGPGMVVAIESLLAGPVGASTIRHGGPDKGPAPANPIELSALGDSLRYAAEQLRAAPGTATLRLAALTQSVVLRAAPGGLGHRPAGPFLAVALNRLERVGSGEPDPELVGVLEKVGTLLAQHGGGDLLGLAHRLEELTGPPVVPITELLATPSRPVPVTAVPAPTEDRTALERSFSNYARLIAARASTGPLPAMAAPPPVPPAPADDGEVVSIESLLLDLPEPAVVPIESLLLDLPEAGVVSIESLLYDAEPVIVPIEHLLLRGRRALERANQIRLQIEGTLQDSPGTAAKLRPLMRELFDLVPLALTADA